MATDSKHIQIKVVRSEVSGRSGWRGGAMVCTSVPFKSRAHTRFGMDARSYPPQGEVVTFRVKPTTKFSKIIKAFCQKEGVDEGSVRFMFDGERLLPDGTPAAMEMEDGDQVDVTNVAVGGAPTV